VPISSAASRDLKLIALVPPGAQIVAGINASSQPGQPDNFLLITHDNTVDLQDFLALSGADGSRIIYEVVFVAIANSPGLLSEHSLLVSGHFDQPHIYKSAVEGGATVTYYRGIPVLVIQPFAREQGAFNNVRWLAVLDSNILAFGTIATLQRELDRYIAHSPADSPLPNRLGRLRAKDQTWCLLSPLTRNDGVLTLSECFDNESEAEKRKEHAIEFLEAGEDATVTLEAAEETLDFIAFLVERPVIAPGLNAIGFGWDYGNHVQREHDLTGFVAFVSAIHDHRHTGEGAQIAKQFSTFGRIMGITWRERERYCGPSIRGNHMNLGSPSAARFADRLRSVFFNAPVPSGCTFTEVESRLKASMRIRTICSNWSFSKTRSMVPLLDQRFIRV
jgi:hypothetical protein